MTPNQLTVLKNSIIADPVLNAIFTNAEVPLNSDGADAIAKSMNAVASPAFTVWKTQVPITVVGDNIVATELAGLSSLNATRLQTIALFSGTGVNPSLADRRAFFDDVFSGAGGVLTRAKLLALWKRLAKRAEKLFSTGTGSDADPATLTFEGDLSYQDVIAARNV